MAILFSLLTEEQAKLYPPLSRAEAGTSGTAFVYVQDGFTFDGFQVDLISTDTAVANITSGFTVNSDFDVVGGTRFNNADVDTNSNGVQDPDETGDINVIPAVDGANGATRFQATSINQNGINTGAFGGFDQGQG